MCVKKDQRDCLAPGASLLTAGTNLDTGLENYPQIENACTTRTGHRVQVGETGTRQSGNMSKLCPRGRKNGRCALQKRNSKKVQKNLCFWKNVLIFYIKRKII